MGAAASRAEHTRDGTVRKRGTFGREERLEGRNVCKERLEGRNVRKGGTFGRGTFGRNVWRNVRKGGTFGGEERERVKRRAPRVEKLRRWACPQGSSSSSAAKGSAGG
jgi:hypothetical protein